MIVVMFAGRAVGRVARTFLALMSVYTSWQKIFSSFSHFRTRTQRQLSRRTDLKLNRERAGFI